MALIVILFIISLLLMLNIAMSVFILKFSLNNLCMVLKEQKEAKEAASKLRREKNRLLRRLGKFPRFQEMPEVDLSNPDHVSLNMIIDEIKSLKARRAHGNDKVLKKYLRDRIYDAIIDLEDII